MNKVKEVSGKVIRESGRIAGQANDFPFLWWHMLVGAVVIGFAIKGVFDTLKDLGVF